VHVKGVTPSMASDSLCSCLAEQTTISSLSLCYEPRAWSYMLVGSGAGF